MNTIMEVITQKLKAMGDPVEKINFITGLTPEAVQNL